MKRILLVALAIFAICITVSAVSADNEWSFSFGSESNTDGGSIEIVNNELKIQDEKFTIPDGFKELEKERAIANQSAIVDGGKVTACVLQKGNETIIVGVHFADGGVKNITTPQNSTNVTIGGHSGVLYQDDDGDAVFDYANNEKIIHIVASSQDLIEQVLK